jgi:ComF family protein
LLCPTCQRRMRRVVPPICPRCGRPQASGVHCPSCVTWDSPLDGIRSPFRFEGLARKAVHELKYRNLRVVSAPMAVLLYDYLERNPMPADVLVPVPLHPKRLRERGYNQSELLAKELAKLVQLPVAGNELRRQRYTPPQARTLSVEERRANMKEAFVSTNESLRERHVLLIDDVSTSATTLDACAGALKSAGAASVWGLVFAREI